MVLFAFLTFVVAALYNIQLGLHLYREKVSNKLHEEYLRKKEIEYTVGVSEMWNSRFFYAFSSFKSDVFKMFHRVIFNTLIFLLVLVHALIVNIYFDNCLQGESVTKIGIITGLLVAF